MCEIIPLSDTYELGQLFKRSPLNFRKVRKIENSESRCKECGAPTPADELKRDGKCSDCWEEKVVVPIVMWPPFREGELENPS